LKEYSISSILLAGRTTGGAFIGHIFTFTKLHTWFISTQSRSLLKKNDSKVWNSELDGYKRKDFFKKLFGEFIFTRVKISSSRCSSHVQEVIKIYLDDVCKHSLKKKFSQHHQHHPSSQSP
jgi:hypothetical protein